jgi:site-specific DNA-methyltransferase (adenine-specific)
MEANQIYLGDCLELMEKIKNETIDMVLCDLPYGTTSCKWDVNIPLDKLWSQYTRIIKKGAPIVLFAAQPFTSILINSNIKSFKYSWVWNKVRAVGSHVCKYRPMQKTEDICVFGYGKINYYPVLTLREKERVGGKEYGRTEIIGGKINDNKNKNKIYTHRQPDNLLTFSNASNKNRFHPTQKPIDLCEYLIKTYSKIDDVILDNCIGSGTTCLAAKNLNRKWIGIEKEEKYYKIAKERLGI